MGAMASDWWAIWEMGGLLRACVAVICAGIAAVLIPV